MVIMHNMLAMNANRMYGINNRVQAKRTEKLSSGYKINRSADDAAGLSISEKMRRQIRGLTQAALNAQDGISMVQIADGGMEEIHDMLHRSTELSIKAANGTLTDEDRSYIQQEIEQIMTEIDGISERTTFNEVKVLEGEHLPFIQSSGGVIISGSMPSWTPMGSNSQLGETYQTTEDYYELDAAGNTTGSLKSMTVNHAAATINFSQFTGSTAQIEELVGSGFYTTCCTCSNHYSIRFDEGTSNFIESSGNHYVYNIGIGDATDATDLLNRIIQGTQNGKPRNHYTKLVADTATGILTIYDDRSKDANPVTQNDPRRKWVGWDNPSFNVTPRDPRGKFGPGTAYDEEDLSKLIKPKPIKLLVGADAEEVEFIQIDLPAASSRAMGIKKLNVETVDSAANAVKKLKEANQYISQERSRMGAYQNRLEHTIKNLDNIVENTQAAESQLRDTDMSELMVKYSNGSILAQAGQAMLAQANLSKQGVMNLLQ